MNNKRIQSDSQQAGPFTDEDRVRILGKVVDDARAAGVDRLEEDTMLAACQLRCDIELHEALYDMLTNGKAVAVWHDDKHTFGVRLRDMSVRGGDDVRR
jgi:hypothetical protein